MRTPPASASVFSSAGVVIAWLGVVHERTFGGTADYRRDEDEATRETRWVAGVRWGF